MIVFFIISSKIPKGVNCMNKKPRIYRSLLVAVFLIIQLFSHGSISAFVPNNPVVLDNGQLRFGTGSENSINATGNLQQPFYKSSDGTARKLTFSSYPLDFELMEGGDGTNWWNRNGSSALNPSLQNQTFDYSKYVQTPTGGYGTIITSGTLLLNGKLVQITHEYVLPQDKFLIQITTTLKNISNTTMTNVRYWVGTQDDYIGNNDVNYKTKGNIVDGEFVAISNQSEQSKALKIYNNNEGVLFYTNSDQANTVVGSRYGWHYIQSLNPVDTPINVYGDNSYAFYVRFDDIAPNEETKLNWYYAAGTTADLDQIIQDVYDSVQLGRNITNDSMEFEINETRDATTYYVVLPSDEPAPTQTQIINGQRADGSSVDIFGQINTLANQPQVVNITDLTPGTQYRIYIVIQYSVEEIVVVDPLDFETTNRYTFTFDSDGGSSIDPITQDAGTAVSLPVAPTKTGHTFLRWNQDVPSSMTNEDMLFTALWQINTYQLIFNCCGVESSISRDVTYNALAQEIETPIRLGYTFNGWFKETGLVNEWDFETDLMPDHNVTLYAEWIPNTNTSYKVEYYQQNLNDDNYTLVTFEDLQGTTDTNAVSEAKVFTGFDENLTHPDRLINGDIEGDGSLVLKRYYDRKAFSITFKDWDDTLLESTVYLFGSLIEFPDDLVRTGYSFNGWSHDTSYVESDMTIYAQYLSNPTTDIQTSHSDLNAIVQGLDESVIFTDEERQDLTSIKLEINIYDSLDLPEDHEILNDYILNTLNIESSRSLILDISLFKTVGNHQTKLTNSHHEITISFVVPSDFKEKDFKLVHIHNGVAQLIDYEFDPETLVVTLTTDKFSTFALLYDNNEVIAETSDSNMIKWVGLFLVLGTALVLITHKRAQRKN
jgi:uncharacterized repeat protein (TIGR02543 family)